MTITTTLQALVLEDMIESDQLASAFHGKRIGYYTGSFDPVHIGHKGFAEGVIEAGLCDYILIVPAWGGDGYKERAPISVRLEMQEALFADNPHIIITRLSPLEVQRDLTKIVSGQTIRGYPVVEAQDETVEFIGLIGSDTALNLAIPSHNEGEEANRKKRLQVFMRGVAIPEKHAETTIGSIMALPVSRFIVGHRDGDNLALLNGVVGDRPISEVYGNEQAKLASSTLVKQRLRNGESVDDLVDLQVNKIIFRYNLYPKNKEKNMKLFDLHRIQTKHHTLYVETLGNAWNPACVLIPGAMEGAWCWSERFCQILADAGFFVVRFDHRDIGRSTQSSLGMTYNLQDLAEDVVTILDALRIEKAHFAGHSMGGHICQQLAIDYPARVISICPIGSAPIGETEETVKGLTEAEQSIMDQTWKVYLARKDSEDPEEHTRGFLEVYRYLHGTLPMDESIARHYISEMVTRSPKETLQAGNPHEKVMARLMESAHERKGILHRIKVPTLIIHGDKEPAALPRFAVSMSREIPEARLEFIQGMGHMFFSKDLEYKITTLLVDHMRGVR
jgi:pimeloyl-ACP methyl ester carboxylesterase/nicotinic acid mononucleotide adenylyltransferase